MKALVLSSFLACGFAQAATVQMALPSTYRITGHSCSPGNAPHVSRGAWSADGLTFEAYVWAATTCASDGRGSHPNTFRGALVVTYDLRGNITSEVRRGVLVHFTPGPWVNPAYTGYEVTDKYRSPYLPDVLEMDVKSAEFSPLFAPPPLAFRELRSTSQ